MFRLAFIAITLFLTCVCGCSGNYQDGGEGASSSETENGESATTNDSANTESTTPEKLSEEKADVESGSGL